MGTQVEAEDVRFHHPFTCLVSGPSGSGKSTFVKNLILNASHYIDTEFDYIYIFIGTSPEKNLQLKEIADKLGPKKVQLCDVRNMFEQDSKDVDLYFNTFLEQLVAERKNENGCFIFDDLMNEIGNTSFICDLFTKQSSHSKISCIQITQNIFYKGKNATQNVTLYRHTKVLVLFHSYLDTTTLNNISSRLATPSKKNTRAMLENIMDQHRYVVIRAEFGLNPDLRISSNYFTRLEKEGILFAVYNDSSSAAKSSRPMGEKKKEGLKSHAEV